MATYIARDDNNEIAVITADSGDDNSNRIESTRERILETGRKLTIGDRQKSYGDPYPNHRNIAGLWNAYLKIRFPETLVELHSSDVATFMELLKIARAGIDREYNEDNYIDAAVYAAIAGELRRGEVNLASQPEGF